MLKYKKRKVSAVRDFPPGGGQNAPRINQLPHNTEAAAQLGDEKKLVVDEKMVNVPNGDCIKTSEIGNKSLSHQVGDKEKLVANEIGKMVNVANGDCVKISEIGNESLSHQVGDKEKFVANEKMVNVANAGGVEVWSPPQWPISDANISKETALKNNYPRRRVSATRDFPPFCGSGSNALCPTEEERLRIVFGNKTSHDLDKAPVQGGLKRKLEGSVPEPKTKSQKVIKKDYEDVNGVKGEVGKEIVVYIHDKGSKSSRPDDAVALGHGAGRVIVQGLMAAPNCPWRQVKGIVNTSQDIVRTGSEVMRHDVSYITGRKKSNSVSRTKKYEADYSGGKSTKKKKLHPYRNDAYESKGQLVVKDEGDFSIQEQDEDSPVAPRPQNFEVALPPFGPNSSSHGNAHVKVRETLRLFQAICRKLLQGEEAKPRQQGCPSKRIDLLASQIVRAKGKEANTGKNIIGSVPRVEVGDEFQYRVELALVGIHHLYQAGIDYINQGEMIIATSIVALGGYPDDLDNLDVLIYSGQGGSAVGRDKQHKDQKLERGNLALKNSITANNPG
ncbi:Histone-lysine N-methyltransferase, H3 lysine-9 specific SUVH5 [Camellia lanceoleosa]|uniref:Histone-lysine N-methyltransferase, H3 lysine-9 specific SUVH5 n=1 Tax=Camellia lanceoleosa TaxID=1840588 RepID=A0ACC0GJG9_9ERIC|nr:Histone-lysine N-methyltransferase, H3 lysine-9 specific SUVH5 [Camellia lanceoleosa]